MCKLHVVFLESFAGAGALGPTVHGWLFDFFVPEPGVVTAVAHAQVLASFVAHRRMTITWQYPCLFGARHDGG